MSDAPFGPRPSPLPRHPDYTAPERDGGPTVVAEVVGLEGAVKLGSVQGFTLICDEASGGPHGGTDQGPTPLGYFTAAVGF